jgi:hypothetical protein
MSSPSPQNFPLGPNVRKPVPAACRYAAPQASPLPNQGGAAASRLAHLYLCEGFSTYGIAQLTGLDRQRVTRLLHRAGVPLRPRGAGGTRPGQRRPDPLYLGLVLAELYVGQRLSSRQIGEMLGLPERRVRERLRQCGIQARTRGGWQREDRRALPAEALQLLYHVQGLSADDVGRKLGTSRKAVLRTAHDLGLPVRTGGTVAPAGPDEIQLIDALYADQFVATVLADHNIVPVVPGGPIWQRFPEPVPLTRQLVTDLYWRCGAGLHHIELLTGQPAQTVRNFMRRTGITTRHPGGRSPFMRRWRARTEVRGVRAGGQRVGGPGGTTGASGAGGT